MTTPASAKQLAAKLRAIEKANPGMKYRALFLSTIGDVAALEAKAEKQEASMKSLADEVEAMHPGAISTLWIARRIRVVLDKATASEGS